MIDLLLGRASRLAAGGARTHTAKADPEPAATPDTLSEPDPDGINHP
jgi:hypothetical protein